VGRTKDGKQDGKPGKKEEESKKGEERGPI